MDSAFISEELLRLGIHEYGFFETAKLSADYAGELPYGISIVVPLSDAVVDAIHTAPTYAYFQHYRAINALIDQAVLHLGLCLAARGARYFPVAASQSIPDAGAFCGLLSHKAAARLSGLGTVGKNALFLSYRYGARVRLGTLLTDWPLPVHASDEVRDVCGACTRCVQACPAMALRGQVWQPGRDRSEIVDAAACSQYMKRQFQHIGRGAVCGICMRACPYRGEERKRHR